MNKLNCDPLKSATADDMRHERFLTECQMFPQSWDNYGGTAAPCCDRCAGR